MIVSRIAPTPSGFLHIGNALNFAVTSNIVRAQRGTLHLRIDDADAARCRPEYLADIFWMLDWLDIEIDHGPGSVAEFHRDYSQTHKFSAYRAELDRPELQGISYPCDCSRAELRRIAADLERSHDCWSKRHERGDARGPIRVRVPSDLEIDTGGQQTNVADELGDFILWRREDLPAYQLVSVVEDRDMGVNLVVRGKDLRPSTAAQLFLADAVDATSLKSATFLHHPLVLAADGSKLSKSDLKTGPLRDLSSPSLREHLARIQNEADRLSETLAS